MNRFETEGPNAQEVVLGLAIILFLVFVFWQIAC